MHIYVCVWIDHMSASSWGSPAVPCGVTQRGLRHYAPPRPPGTRDLSDPVMNQEASDVLETAVAPERLGEQWGAGSGVRLVALSLSPGIPPLVRILPVQPGGAACQGMSQHACSSWITAAPSLGGN